MECPGHLRFNARSVGIAPMMSAVMGGSVCRKMIRDAAEEIPRRSNPQPFPAQLAARWAATAGALAMPN